MAFCIYCTVWFASSSPSIESKDKKWASGSRFKTISFGTPLSFAGKALHVAGSSS
jgi:hypothetical protein